MGALLGSALQSTVRRDTYGKRGTQTCFAKVPYMYKAMGCYFRRGRILIILLGLMGSRRASDIFISFGMIHNGLNLDIIVFDHDNRVVVIDF